jgi:hypothetical protein
VDWYRNRAIARETRERVRRLHTFTVKYPPDKWSASTSSVMLAIHLSVLAHSPPVVSRLDLLRLSLAEGGMS